MESTVATSRTPAAIRSASTGCPSERLPEGTCSFEGDPTFRVAAQLAGARPRPGPSCRPSTRTGRLRAQSCSNRSGPMDPSGRPLRATADLGLPTDCPGPSLPQLLLRSTEADAAAPPARDSWAVEVLHARARLMHEVEEPAPVHEQMTPGELKHRREVSHRDIEWDTRDGARDRRLSARVIEL